MESVGRALASELAGKGVRVAITARRPDHLEAAKELITLRPAPK
jgi:NADP-dependent 3-hydroxy acid dehydrogenase YdfG